MVLCRNATAEDIDKIAFLESNIFTSGAWSKTSFENDILRNECAVVIVVEVDGKLVGYADLWLVADEATLNDIAVSPLARGKGYGRMLMLNLIDIAREENMKVIFLEVRESNEVAINLYSSLGFEVFGRRKKYYPDGEDALTMRMSL